MFQQEHIESTIWAFGGHFIDNDHIEIQRIVLQAALQDFNFDVQVKKTNHKRTKVFGYYDFEKNKCTVALGQQRGVNFNPLTPETLTSFLFDVNCTVQHELIHKYQWLQRDHEIHGPKIFHSTEVGRKKSKQEYLGNQDEIEAQAHDAAMEIGFLYPDMLPKSVITDYFSERSISIPTINSYMKAFDGDMTHPVLQEFFKRLFKWIDIVKVRYPHNYRIKE